jgi:hypothetical protein
VRVKPFSVRPAEPVNSSHRARESNRRRQTPFLPKNRSCLHRADGMLGDGQAAIGNRMGLGN